MIFKKKKIRITKNLEGLELPKLTIFGEFKKFALRGNVIDLAVGVIIGGAFQKIVTSVVNDLIMPWIGLVTGSVNFNDQFLILKLPDGVIDKDVTSLSVAQQLGVTTFNYGSFITSLIDFIIMAFVIFMMVKIINRISDIRKKPEEATTKVCPYCCSTIDLEATRCPNCTSMLKENETDKKADEDTPDKRK